ncbi:TlpA family protein disulfide reductase [Sphingobacterium haloxyli]|uniref:Thioredoxin domain-containing protein n=1 Tax=Sphingobacterium haloxyli TaxID=2100533 RepID=A0A2S9J2E8_9SPHI|nr:hypothetical protein [Sphingobacterium haloxyli]PRD46914.1 hypothetical protein C5745_12505 [Sphingobacterium haloxyli]
MLFNLSTAQAQSPENGEAAEGQTEIKPLVVGQKVPEEFWTREHLFYVDGDTVRKTLEEYRGKLLILDFWFSGCLKCLLHQQEINYFEKKYSHDLKVVRVNSMPSRENYTKLDLYFKSERFLRLGLTTFDSIIEDDYLYGLFAVSAYPNYFWINRDGILQLQTFRNLLDRTYQAPFIDNEL